MSDGSKPDPHDGIDHKRAGEICNVILEGFLLEIDGAGQGAVGEFVELGAQGGQGGGEEGIEGGVGEGEAGFHCGELGEHGKEGLVD